MHSAPHRSSEVARLEAPSAQIVNASHKELCDLLRSNTPGLDEQGKAHHEPKHAQQLDIKVKDLKANDRFRLYFLGEKVTATVPGAPPGAKLVPGATVTLHYPVPKGSKPVDEIQRLCGDDFSDRVKVLQAHKPSDRADQYQAQAKAADMEDLQQNLSTFKLVRKEPVLV